jgi:3-oxoacyl-[acyl-carrier-protein] synthase III
MQRGPEPLYPPARHGVIDLQARHAYFDENVMPAAEAAGRLAGLHTELVKEALADADIAIGDVTRLIYHNMAAFVLDQFYLAPVGLPLELSTWDFGRTVGHMGASDQVVSLEHLLLTSALAPGDHVLLCGGAAGFASCCAVLEILQVPAWTAEPPAAEAR